jgi:hypothetical protein
MRKRERMSSKVARLAAGVCAALLATQAVAGQTQAPGAVEIPKTATALEGTPTVRIDSTASGTARTVLSKTEASQHKLAVKMVDGKPVWASQGGRPLNLDVADGYTYLSSDPGHYIRLRKLKDRISYVEHLDSDPGHVTYWGELRIVLGK